MISFLSLHIGYARAPVASHPGDATYPSVGLTPPWLCGGEGTVQPDGRAGRAGIFGAHQNAWPGRHRPARNFTTDFGLVRADANQKRRSVPQAPPLSSPIEGVEILPADDVR